jgi:hypothetical protein
MAEVIGQGTTDLGDGFHIPTKILENNMLSETSQAHLCFTEQKFSATLQAFLLDYVISISGNQSVYA